MKGVWLEKKELTFRHDIPKDFPKNEVLVKVLRSGICNTDIELMKGYYPYTGIIGHEFVGMYYCSPLLLLEAFEVNNNTYLQIHDQ